MSLLDAYKVQRSNKKSIQELALLPQDIIMGMAQIGDISSEIVPIVIAEKARMIKENANRKALMEQMSQGQPTTTTEQNLNLISENEQQTNAADAGIPGLPMRNDIFRGAGGGIVAFSDGGVPKFAGPDGSEVDFDEVRKDLDRQLAKNVKAAKPSSIPADDLNAISRQIAMDSETPDQARRFYRPEDFPEVLRMVQSTTNPFRQLSPEELEERKMLSEALSPKSLAKKKDILGFIAGMEMLGSRSPYFAESAGKAGAKYGSGLQSLMEEEEKLKRTNISAAAQRARQKRGEDFEDFKIAQSMIEKDAQLAAQYNRRDTDLKESTEIFFNELVAAGSDPNDPRTRAKAREKASYFSGYRGPAVDQRAAQDVNTLASRAVTETNDALQKENRYRILDLQRLGKDKSKADAANQEMRQMYLDTLNRNRYALNLPPLTLRDIATLQLPQITPRSEPKEKDNKGSAKVSKDSTPPLPEGFVR